MIRTIFTTAETKTAYPKTDTLFSQIVMIRLITYYYLLSDYSYIITPSSNSVSHPKQRKLGRTELFAFFYISQFSCLSKSFPRFAIPFQFQNSES